MVLEVGETVRLAPVFPVLHVYEVPPDAVSVVDSPKQIWLSPVMATLMLKPLTVTCREDEAVQPCWEVTVTE